MPSSLVSDAYAERWAEVAAGKQPGSQNAKDEEASFYDYAHCAIGAAYCDAFTCDRGTAKCLGDVRAQLGFGPPYVVTGDAAAFVKALEAEPFGVT